MSTKSFLTQVFSYPAEQMYACDDYVSTVARNLVLIDRFVYSPGFPASYFLAPDSNR